jgi:hypothetical protein
MLQLKKIGHTVQEFTESDFYVPINIHFANYEKRDDSYTYWYTGKYLELAIDRKSGAIGKVALLSVTKVYFNNPQAISSECFEKSGFPLLKTSHWPEKINYIKENADKDFEIYVEENKVRIVLIRHKIKLKVINDRVVFGFNANNVLCTIEVTKMSKDEMQLLEESLHSLLKNRNQGSST